MLGVKWSPFDEAAPTGLARDLTPVVDDPAPADRRPHLAAQLQAGIGSEAGGAVQVLVAQPSPGLRDEEHDVGVGPGPRPALAGVETEDPRRAGREQPDQVGHPDQARLDAEGVEE